MKRNKQILSRLALGVSLSASLTVPLGVVALDAVALGAAGLGSAPTQTVAEGQVALEQGEVGGGHQNHSEIVL